MQYFDRINRMGMINLKFILLVLNLVYPVNPVQFFD